MLDWVDWGQCCGEVRELDASDGMLDGSVMIYTIEQARYYNATGTTGDQRYA